MDKLIVGIIVAAATAALLFVVVLFGTIMGAFAGWVVGWFFDDTLRILMARVGLEGIPFWQFGAMLGFVGSFFRSTNTNSCK